MTAGAHARLRAPRGLPAMPPAAGFSRRGSTVLVDEAMVERFQCDVRPLIYGAPPDAEHDISGSAFIDEFGVTWRRHSDTHYINANGPFQQLPDPTPDDVARFRWPDPADPSRYQGLGERAKTPRGATDYAVPITSWLGPVHLSQFMRGYAEWLEDLLVRPAFVEALLDYYVAVWIEATSRILAACSDHVDLVLIGDDIATQTGPLFRPELYRRLIKPYHQRMVEAVKRCGKAVVYHSCGAVRPFIRDLIEIGVDALNPVQVSAAGMDPAELKREFGREIAFWGGIDTQRVLSRGSQDQVREQVRRTIAHLGAGGGYVLCAVHNIQAEVPPANVEAMYEAAIEFGA